MNDTDNATVALMRKDKQWECIFRFVVELAKKARKRELLYNPFKN